MIQKIIEFIIDCSIDNIKLFTFITNLFPKRSKMYFDRLESEANEVYIPEEELQKSSHRVWQRLCDQCPDLDRSKF